LNLVDIRERIKIKWHLIDERGTLNTTLRLVIQLWSVNQLKARGVCQAWLAMVTLQSSLLFDSDTDSLIESVVDSVIDSVVDSVNDSVNDLDWLPIPYAYFPCVYIEALVPYRINRVLILLIRFNNYCLRQSIWLWLFHVFHITNISTWYQL